MASFGVDATKMSDPNLGAASHVTPGVQDNSGAMRTGAVSDLLKSLGPQAVEGYKAYEVDKLNVATQDTISGYMSQRDNPELAKDSLAGAAAQDIQTSVFGTEGAALSAVEKAQKDRLNIYQKALAEGVMSPEEFHTRTLSNLREAINKNPGLERELRGEAARVLELSGITGVLKVDQEIAQSKQKKVEKDRDNLYERAKRAFIPHGNGIPDYKVAEQVIEYEKDMHLYNAQVREKDRMAMLSTEQARQYNNDLGPNVLRGAMAETQRVLFDMIDTQGITASTYPKFKAQVEAQLDDSHLRYVQSIPASIRQDPNSQQLIDLHAKNIERQKVSLANMSGGEDLKKIIGNEVEIAKGTQTRELLKTHNMAEIELVANLARSAPEAVISSELRPRFMSIIENVAKGNFSAPSMSEVIPKSDQDKTSGVVVQSSLTLGEKTGDWQGLGKTLEAMNKVGPEIGTPKQRLQFLHNNLSVIARGKPMQMDAYSINQVETSVGQMVNDPNFGIGTLVDTTKGKKVSMDILPSGMLIFNGADAAQFNGRYANSVNVALGAYANAHNMTMKEAAKTFYPKYFSDLVKVEGK